jgi:O-antigen/teichoic acid export membrane protein
VPQIAVTLAIVPAVMVTTTLGSMILGSNRAIAFAAVTLAQWSVTIVVQIGLALAGKLDPTTALAAWLSGAIASVIVGAVLLRGGIRWRLGFDRSAFRELFNFGLKGYLANLLQFFNYRLDSLIVNALSGIASVGVYSISVAMAEVIWYVAQAFGTVMFPHVSSVDRREADRVTPIVSRNVWFITLLGVVFVAVTGRWIIAVVFGPAMAGAATPLLLLLPGILALSGAKILTSYLSGIGRPIYATYVSGANVALTVALDLVLIPRFGISGAAAASSIVYTITAIAFVIVFRKESGAPLVETIVIQPQDLSYYMRAARTVAGVFGSPSPAKP